ncbi:MAG: BlaI/MecI/CopY family transcriptional regulator [Actinobacteria bacterium]|nr:BlaI/MecI/CopY family transcriptional regulator [Actinomycetota bacterium]
MQVPKQRSGPKQILGDLEGEVLECVWQRGPVSVREVHSHLAARREIAYTTVMTVMSRLAEKGLLQRRPEGRAFIYSASMPRDEYWTEVVKNFLDGVLQGANRPLLSHFVESLAADDAAQLDLLADIIEEKRRKRACS